MHLRLLGLQWSESNERQGKRKDNESVHSASALNLNASSTVQASFGVLKRAVSTTIHRKKGIKREPDNNNFDEKDNKSFLISLKKRISESFGRKKDKLIKDVDESRDTDEGNMYRRGARRWRKLYRVNGHLYQAKRFSRKVECAFCNDGIWGLGRQGYKCVNCKLLVHKKCHKLIKLSCRAVFDAPDSRLKEEAGQTAAISNKNKGSQNGEKPASSSAIQTQIAMVTDQMRKENNPENCETSAVQVQKTADDSAPTRGFSLEDFDLINVIGRGSYAKVMVVEQKETKRLYAMKVIKKETVANEEDIDWVQTEKHVFEVASNHPFLVGLHSCFQTPSRLFYIIEFVNGGDLMFHMQRQRRLPEEHGRFYAAELSLALHYLHERGIIYRDLKLDNVLLDSEGHIKLTDYGLCKVI
ncbi:DgyrCDS10630 [Dimorphilus gyrociliatus]|uniref:non-specific serine/threonine protein kinase n=1 Tax=Dimorphilus gyrociliatus TaxID=2664684 RepID=A0A7I8W5W0_9ANNE|nr:DgyrCDS10630 [Dimorphilus gyrociliatus]